jgi:hypothetical protein
MEQLFKNVACYDFSVGTFHLVEVHESVWGTSLQCYQQQLH